MAAKRKRKSAATAVLLVDVINAFDFEGAQALVRAARRAAPHIRALASRARGKGVPVVYVNDNFGRWRSDFQATLEACSAPSSLGREVAEQLRPEKGDYFVLKPLHSGFQSTPLDLLLRTLGVSTLVMTGFAANICVVFTANDAHMLGYRLFVPSDCTASNSPALTRAALKHVEVALHGDVRRASDIDFGRIQHTKRARGAFR